MLRVMSPRTYSAVTPRSSQNVCKSLLPLTPKRNHAFALRFFWFSLPPPSCLLITRWDEGKQASHRPPAGLRWQCTGRAPLFPNYVTLPMTCAGASEDVLENAERIANGTPVRCSTIAFLEMFSVPLGFGNLCDKCSTHM